jgi:hypothetical protein
MPEKIRNGLDVFRRALPQATMSKQRSPPKDQASNEEGGRGAILSLPSQRVGDLVGNQKGN